MHFRRPSRLRVMIDIAPLVDVVFLLVIFFAVSTSFLDTSGLKLDLPTSNATAQRSAREITVNLAADGRMEFDGAVVDRDALLAGLRKALEGSDKKIVVLRADTETPHGVVVNVMDLIREAGADGLTIATRTAGS